MSDDSRAFAANFERFTGFADTYDRHRPAPPEMLATLAAQFGRGGRPALVVDLGSGTGLSTRYWAGHADAVIGIEPTADMRRQAQAATAASNVSYREALSHRTGLPDHSAHVVSVSQALHWMEPQATFEEVRRILVPGGVFLACDFDWPPATGAWEADAAFAACSAHSEKIENERGGTAGLREWPKSGHLDRMAASGCFRHLREMLLHHTDSGDAERLIGLLRSQGYMATLKKLGASDTETGFDVFAATVRRVLAGPPRPWMWSARVRLGVV